MREEWKDIEGYEGMYQVSNLGNVKSLNYRRTGKERILKGRDVKGYLRVGLWKDGENKDYLIHRLVGQAFLENPNNLPILNHKDENKYNNCVQNLEWCDYSYNNTYNGRAKKAGKKVAEKLRGRKQTEESNKKRAEKMSKPVFSVNKESGLIMWWQSASEAERITGINNGSITKCCKGRYKSAGGYVWFYAEEED